MQDQYAEILRAIADGKDIELQSPRKDWKPVSRYSALVSIANYIPAECFRVKKEVLMIGDVEVPVPLRKKPDLNSKVYIPDITRSSNQVMVSTWFDDEHDNYRLENGLIHLTKEAAFTHAKALLKLSQPKV